MSNPIIKDLKVQYQTGAKKNKPTETWQGIQVNCERDGVKYAGKVFPVRSQEISNSDAFESAN